MSELIRLERAHVVEDGDAGPAPAEVPAVVFVDFAEGDGSHSSSLEAEGEPTDAGEEVKNPHDSPLRRWERLTSDREGSGVDLDVQPADRNDVQLAVASL